MCACMPAQSVAVLVASNMPRPHQSLCGGRNCALVTPPFVESWALAQLPRHLRANYLCGGGQASAVK